MPEANRKPIIPPCSLRRGIIYLRALAVMNKRDDETVSSDDLARLLCLNNATVRRDLSLYGKLGRRGVGYRVGALRNRLHELCRSPVVRRGALVGVGRLGTAFLGHGGLLRVPDLDVRWAFDVDPAKIGTEIAGVRVWDAREMTGIVRREGIELGIVCVPAETAQDTAEALVAGGIRALLNFAPVQLNLPDHILVSNIDLTVELENLLLSLAQMETVRASCD